MSYFQIQYIKKSRKNPQTEQQEYLIHWKGYQSKQDEWIAFQNLQFNDQTNIKNKKLKSKNSDKMRQIKKLMNKFKKHKKKLQNNQKSVTKTKEKRSLQTLKPESQSLKKNKDLKKSQKRKKSDSKDQKSLKNFQMHQIQKENKIKEKDLKKAQKRKKSDSKDQKSLENFQINKIQKENKIKEEDLKKAQKLKKSASNDQKFLESFQMNKIQKQKKKVHYYKVINNTWNQVDSKEQISLKEEELDKDIYKKIQKNSLKNLSDQNKELKQNYNVQNDLKYVDSSQSNENDFTSSYQNQNVIKEVKQQKNKFNPKNEQSNLHKQDHQQNQQLEFKQFISEHLQLKQLIIKLFPQKKHLKTIKQRVFPISFQDFQIFSQEQLVKIQDLGKENRKLQIPTIKQLIKKRKALRLKRRELLQFYTKLQSSAVQISVQTQNLTNILSNFFGAYQQLIQDYQLLNLRNKIKVKQPRSQSKSSENIQS